MEHTKDKKKPRYSKSRPTVLSIEGDSLLVSFGFDKKKFDAIRKFSAAKYSKEKKRWELPLIHLPVLEASELFNRDVSKYTFELGVVDSTLSNLLEEREAAKERHRKNPFAVSSEDLRLLDVDVVVSLDKKAESLRVTLKKGKKLNQRLESIEGVHYLKDERAYFLPTQALVSYLQELRDNGISFGVEKVTGEKLKVFSELRNKIISEDYLPSSQELSQSYLRPFLSVTERDGLYVYSLVGATREQRAELFPVFDGQRSRKTQAQSFNCQEARELLFRSLWTQTRIWLPQEAQEEVLLKSSESKVKKRVCKESDLLFLTAPIIWCMSIQFEPCILIDEKHLQSKDLGLKKLVHAHGELTFFQHPTHKAYQVPRSKLVSFYKELKERVKEDAMLSTEEFLNYRFTEEEREERVLKKKARIFDESSEIEILDKEIEKKLFPHQKIAVRWMLETPEAFLGDDMGLGKTISVLASFNELKLRDEVQMLLVICPNSLTKNWLKESRVWLSQYQAMAVPQVKGPREGFFEKLLKIKPRRCDILVVNYESLRVEGVAEALIKLCEEEAVFLCVDESQRAKNPTSKTFERLKQVAERARRKVLASGTPTPKDLSDIWAQMYVLDGGERLGKNYFRWLEHVAELGNKWSDFAIKKYRPLQVEETVSRVQELLLRRRKEEVLQLPEKLFSERYIALSGDQKSRYEEIRKELLLRVTSASGEEFTKEINNILEQYLRAVQVASNPRLVDPEWKGEPAKFLELDEIVEEVVREREQKIVIWTNYRNNIKELTKRYENLGCAGFFGDTSIDERERIVESFQSKEGSSLKILVAIPSAGGVGITLTQAQTAVYMDLTWNAEHRLQSVDRLHRIGQTGTVHIITLLSSPIDTLIFKNIKKKQENQARLLGDGIAEEILPTHDELKQAVHGSYDKLFEIDDEV